ncbi:unnamed protein product [Sphagnum jensenii]|uniref:Uncharacterized protein n=1 Tax=Sphagnum jensenii TaxID=128206 RepID=A0ABP0WWQ9_9BRYO
MLRQIAPRDPGRAAGERVLRLWSRGASGGCQADAAADRMLSLLREEESSACGAELHPAGIMRMPWRIVC